MGIRHARIIATALGVVSLSSGCAPYSALSRKPVSRIAATSEQRELARMQRLPAERRLGRLIDTAYDATNRMAADSADVAAGSDYNFAVARIVEVIEENDLAPWEAPLICPSSRGDHWRFTVPLPDPRPEFHLSKWEILPSDRYAFRGKIAKTSSVREGIGAPAVAVGRGLDFTEIDSFSQSEQIFYGLTAVLRFDGRDCRLEYLDPLDVESLSFTGRTFPLGADFQAPLALKLAEMNPLRQQLSKMLRPDRYNGAARVARLQPYSPERIPVLFIHGFGNSPATWMPVLSYLRSDLVIRERYQFWFFSHPTGIPYPISAAALREQLDEIGEHYPDRKEIVVIGHSMGGMIARLLMTDSETDLWDSFYDQPPDQIPFSKETHEVVTDTLIFKPRRDIARIIFVSASHRGSDHAARLAGRLGARLIGNPIADPEVNREAMVYLRAGVNIRVRQRLPNSVEVLDPDSNWLRIVHTLPLDRSIPFHSIMGDRGRGGNLDRTRPQSSDGVVPYWSSHLEGAESEVTIPSGHWSHLHPDGMAEIRRLLLLHLRGLKR